MRAVSSSRLTNVRGARLSLGRALWPAGILLCVVLGAPPVVDRAEPQIMRRAGSVPADSSHRAGLLWASRITTASGETVAVNVSDRLPEPDTVGRRWAEFLAALPHGPELGLLEVVVVDPTELASECGGGALGCYGQDRLVIPADAVDGTAPEEVARHEYGHHIAAHRANPPWRAIDWGPKHWASATSTCSRVATGAVFPGNEDDQYGLNPGEGFAEAYRVLVERDAGIANSRWSLVSGLFFPDQAALDAIRRDVSQPWTGPTSRVVRVRFGRKLPRVRTMQLSTPLDGDVTVDVALPSGSLHDVALIAPDGRTVLARALWNGSRTKRLAATVCGQRSLTVRVTQRGLPGAATVRVTHP